MVFCSELIRDVNPVNQGCHGSYFNQPGRVTAEAIMYLSNNIMCKAHGFVFLEDQSTNAEMVMHFVPDHFGL